MLPALKTGDRRRLYVRARAVTHLHELRNRFEDRDQNELDRAVLDHAEKMLVNVMRKLGLRIPPASGRERWLITPEHAAEIVTALDRTGNVTERLMGGAS